MGWRGVSWGRVDSFLGTLLGRPLRTVEEVLATTVNGWRKSYTHKDLRLIVQPIRADQGQRRVAVAQSRTPAKKSSIAVVSFRILRETSAAKKRRCAAANEKGAVQGDTRLPFSERSDSICVFPVIGLNIKPHALKSRTL